MMALWCMAAALQPRLLLVLATWLLYLDENGQVERLADLAKMVESDESCERVRF